MPADARVTASASPVGPAPTMATSVRAGRAVVGVMVLSPLIRCANRLLANTC